MTKRRIIVLGFVLLAAAAAFGVYWQQRPEKLRQEVLDCIGELTDLTDYTHVWDEGRMLERHLVGWEADQIGLDGSVTNAAGLRRVSSVPELEPPLLCFGERIVCSGGMLYCLYPDSDRAIEVRLDENDGYWLELCAEEFDRTDTDAKAYFREKMKQLVLKKFSPGDSDECSTDGLREVEIKTQEGLELILRCIENANVYDTIGATSCAIEPPYVYVGGKSLGNCDGCGYSEGGRGRSASFSYTSEDSEALREYIDALFDSDAAKQTQ